MKHREAFCLMTYNRVPHNPTAAVRPAGPADPNAPETLTIWNSRDGVTPFMTVMHGWEYMHDMKAMRIAPTYASALTPGDLVWESVTQESAAEYACSAEMQAAYEYDLALAQVEGPAWWVELYPTFTRWAIARAFAMYGTGEEPNLREVDQEWIDGYLWYDSELEAGRPE
ncbi:hypothetical protein [Deinococcus sp. UYEF24]